MTAGDDKKRYCTVEGVEHVSGRKHKGRMQFRVTEYRPISILGRNSELSRDKKSYRIMTEFNAIR